MREAMIRPVMRDDWDQWLPLWEGYNSFYERVVPPDVTQATWQRFFDPSEPVHALVASHDGTLLGLVHYIFHRSTSAITPVCYLQDLFAREEARGLGIGRQLVEAVYTKAREAASPRVYWLTHETNSRAMMLYDKVAERSGFVQYRKAIG
ncbi:GNAT family N-acetyltransferase [Chelatococcus asaccharovorans]|uniref:GNAT family N-acetyltransferase n=1 Tax=Chelatococcus asaccharovorans TaxID=28210 RepID=UPI00224C640B|nr:GNAT family N-acetyltransferase [Chelatococcus asaccharovorans]CAH1649496.1 Acetyltransferase (GNAT) family protein [Chelatococcus asaccharovorans]CAH1691612.1 Acetyltransferase (GNAT) family protein [Chelatococcus asaccharovorans]